MADYRRRKVSKYMTPFVKTVLEREGIPFEDFEEISETHNSVGVALTSAKFAEVIENAMCLEEEKNRYDGKVKVVTLKQSYDGKALTKLVPSRKGFVVREKEYDKWLKTLEA